MQVFNLTSPWVFKCIPSIYNSGEISLYLRDELKDVTETIAITGVFFQNFQLFLNFSDFEMSEGQSFEVEVKENSKTIYKGKAFATSQTDLENYEINKGVLKV